jgi:hypothetical protein
MRLLSLGLLTALLAGCGGGVTETGYEPRHLGLGDAQRRALYAPKYSPEQAQGNAERDAEMARRRPGGAGGFGI